MKRLARVKPIRPAPVVTPQCCVSFDGKMFQKHYLERRSKRCAAMGWNPAKCTKPSSYKIDGNHYCTQHAGQLAIKILLEDKP